MGRIKKIATERHTATASPFISGFVKESTSIPLSELPAKLDSFPQQWPFPRGDLYHWIPLLDRFDHLLELFNQEYGLNEGPQQEAFACRLLLKGDGEEGMPYPLEGTQQHEIDALVYSSEGDREVIEEHRPLLKDTARALRQSESVCEQCTPQRSTSHDIA